MADATEERASLLRRVLGEKPRRLWCALLTPHRRIAGGVEIDLPHLQAHVRSIGRYVGGFLIAGTTGDGWDMNDKQFARIVEEAADDTVFPTGVPRMIGALAATTKAVLARAKIVTSIMTTPQPLFALCPPVGANHSEEAIEKHLRTILDALAEPVSLYELPQVTKNHVTPRILERLARRYPRIIMLKDSSGEDAVATAGLDYGGVFLVRGAESDYARHLVQMGGRYDGLLLSTANNFSPQLAELMTRVESGERDKALALSDRLTVQVGRMFEAVGELPFSNIFANANRAMDHLLAFGSRWSQERGPFSFGGEAIDPDRMKRLADVLRQENLFPTRGYME